jgi:hypothetical protein
MRIIANAPRIKRREESEARLALNLMPKAPECIIQRQDELEENCVCTKIFVAVSFCIAFLFARLRSASHRKFSKSNLQLEISNQRARERERTNASITPCMLHRKESSVSNFSIYLNKLARPE